MHQMHSNQNGVISTCILHVYNLSTFDTEFYYVKQDICILSVSKDVTIIYNVFLASESTKQNVHRWCRHSSHQSRVPDA